MSKVESFTGINSAVKAFLLNWSSFFDLCFVLAVQGAAVITSSIYHYCVARQKEFSRRVEMSKVESFNWNKLSSRSFSFELEQFFFNLCFVLAVQGAALITSSIYHYGVVREKELLYFRIRIDFRYCDFYMLILGLCESESESQSESEFLRLPPSHLCTKRIVLHISTGTRVSSIQKTSI